MLKPLNDYVLVEILGPSEKTPGGLLLPENRKETSQIKKGVVRAVGTGRWWPKDLTRTPMTLREGDQVLINWAGVDVEMDKVKYRIIREDDVLALIQ